MATIFNNGSEKPVLIDDEAIDIESQRGRFGWITLSNIHIPYLVRKTRKFLSVRMIECTIFKPFLDFIGENLYKDLRFAKSYFVTTAEKNLLNEINHWHCNSFFGSAKFKDRDLLIEWTDFLKAYDLFLSCYKLLTSNETPPFANCGILYLDSESHLTYVIQNNIPLVPIFYFHDPEGLLKDKIISCTGHHLSYLKLLFNLQGLNPELYVGDELPTVALNILQTLLPENTIFFMHWPKELFRNQFIVTDSKNRARIPGYWTHRPIIKEFKEDLDTGTQHNQNRSDQETEVTAGTNNDDERVEEMQGVSTDESSKNCIIQ